MSMTSKRFWFNPANAVGGLEFGDLVSETIIEERR